MSNYLWSSFIANNSGNAVLMSCSADGVNWTNNTDINQSSKFAPSLAVFNNRVYVAFIANNPGNAVLVCSTSDGVNWTNNTDINQSSKFAPSLAVFNGRLYVSFIANNAGNAVLVCSSADGVNWTNNTDINQSSKFAPSLAVFNNRLYVSFIANNPGNAVLVCSSSDGVNWTNNTNINQTSKFAPSLAAFNNHLYVSFIANNPGNAVLVCSSSDGVNWTNNTDINQTSKFEPSLGVLNNQLYVSFIANNAGNAVLVCSSSDGVHWTNNTNINQSSQFGPGLAQSTLTNWPIPSSGLGSNSNYIFDNNCKPITNLSITLNITQDIVCNTASGPQSGFGFQLNAYSPQNETSAWQQYVIALWGSELVGAVDNWPLSGPNIINDFFNLTAMPSASIPAGYKLKISLQNDNNNNITGATYLVIDNNGNTKANVTLSLLSISGVTAADLAPIIAFELNLVGPVNGESAILSSGAGSIVYTASEALTPLTQEPPCAESGYITAETANTFYGALSTTASTTFNQSFTAEFTAKPINKPGKPRPSSKRIMK